MRYINRHYLSIYPPSTRPWDVAKLCDGFCHFFEDKLETIADTVATHLSNAPGYYQQASKRQEPRLLDELALVTVDEVVKLMRSLSKSSPDDFMPTTVLKFNVNTTHRRTG